MRFGLREKLFVLLLVGIPMATWWFVFRPSNALIADMTAQISVQRDKLQSAQRAVSTIGDLEKGIKSLAEAVEFFQSKLPTQKEIDEVLRGAWRLAESNDLVTKSIHTLDPNVYSGFTSPGSGYCEQPVAVELEGDFLGFYTFLLALENQPRIMRIREINLKKLPKGPEGHVQASFTMCVFFERGGP